MPTKPLSEVLADYPELDGDTGPPGLSAYQVALVAGFVGSENQWLESLKGLKGDPGDRGIPGTNGSNGNDGNDGPSAYAVAVANGFVGNIAAWLLSLKGAKGDPGDQGIPGNDGEDGNDGTNGLSAYQVAVINGFSGSEPQWLLSLIGPQGDPGNDGSDAAVTNTNVNTAISADTGATKTALSLVKGDVGLSNVDNTSDVNKPVSTATQTALDGKASTGHNHAGIYSPVGHSHAITDVTGLETALAGKQPSGSYANSTHSHDDLYYTEAEVTAFLNGKSNTSHNHEGAYQPLDSDLTAIAALTQTAFGRNFLELADAAAARLKLGLGTAALSAVGDFQPIDGDLTSIAALTTTTFGRNFLELADAAAGRTKLALGTAAQSASGDFQPIDSDLTAIAALSTTTYGRALLTLADAAALTAAVNTFTATLKGLVPPPVTATGKYLKDDGTWASPAGGADPWTRTVLQTDYTNATITPGTITDGTRTFSYTPPANSNYTIEAELLVWTTAPANLPMISVNVVAGGTAGYGACDILGPGATVNAAPAPANGGWNNPGAVQNFSQAAGGVLTASVPYVVKVTIKGRSGAAPTAISLQMRAESAGANICFVKAGSEMRTRSGY
jgi:hypothetical protein